MATRKKSPMIPDLSTPMTPLEINQLSQEAQRQEQREARSIADETGMKHKRWMWDNAYSHYRPTWFHAIVILAAIGTSAALGFVTRPIMERQTTMAQIAQSITASVPAVRALDVAMDPGKYSGKLIDVVMSVNRGGVYKSGKGLYVQESEEGMSLVVFESGFQGFYEAWGLTRPDEIPARLIGKVIRARGTVRTFNNRLSMIIYAPGLISELPMP